MATTPGPQDQRELTLEALERRFTIAKAELLQQQKTNKKTPAVERGKETFSNFEENGQAYSQLSKTIHENLRPTNSKFSNKKGSMADKILHELLQSGDYAHKYMQGSRSIKIDNWILHDNYGHGRVMSTGSHMKTLKKHSKRSERHMFMKLLKKSGVFKLPKLFKSSLESTLAETCKRVVNLQIGEDWDDSLQSKEQIEASLLSKQEGAMRRERAMA